MKRNTRKSGFTLVELMVGLIIIGIISVLFLWTGTSLQRTYRVRDAIQQAVGAVKYARMQAAIRNQNYRLQVCPFNSSCTIVDHSNLSSFGIVQPSLAGLWFIEQCPTAKLDGTICGDPGQRHELKFFDMSRAYREVELYQMNVGVGNNSQVNQMMLYFRPDGRILSCARQPATNRLTCTRNTYTLCFRVSPNIEASGPNSIPRRVVVSFTGRVQVLPDAARNVCQ